MAPIRLAFFLFCVFLSASVTTNATQDLLGANDAQPSEANNYLTKLVENDAADDDNAAYDDSDSADDNVDFYESGSEEDTHSYHKQTKPSKGSINNKINRVTSTIVKTIVKKVKSSRHCLFPVVTKSARVLNRLVVGLYKVWENYRRNHLPMLKMPSEIAQAILKGKVDFVALIHAGLEALNLGLQALKGTGPILKSYVKCRMLRYGTQPGKPYNFNKAIHNA